MNTCKVERVLLTGGGGFLGLRLATRWLERGVSVVGVTDVLPPAELLPTGLVLEQGDIRDQEQMHDLLERVRPDLVYHLAAVTNVGYSWMHPDLTFQVNLVGSAVLLEAITRLVPNARVVMVSTAELYGQDPKGISLGGLSVNSPYSLSKLAMELLGGIYVRSKGLNLLRVRPFNFTGPGQNDRFISSDFALQVARIEAGVQEPTIRVGNLAAVRDFSDVRDIARYLEHLALHPAVLWDGETAVDLCSGQAIAMKGLLDTLLELSSCSIRIEVDTERYRPADTPVLKGNPAYLQERLGLRPEYTLRMTLQDLLDEARRAVASGH